MRVELITHTPNPEEVLVSAFSECYQLGKKEKRPNIDVVIRNLKHQSVLEHISYTFKITGSRAFLAQLTRHRIASYTVESQRYNDYSEGFGYYTPPTIQNNHDALTEYRYIMNILRESYKALRNMGITKEDARYILPQATEVNLTMTINLRSLINFWSLRLDKHAQLEIRVIASVMFELVMETIPNLRTSIEELVKGDVEYGKQNK